MKLDDYNKVRELVERRYGLMGAVEMLKEPTTSVLQRFNRSNGYTIRSYHIEASKSTMAEALINAEIEKVKLEIADIEKKLFEYGVEV